MSLERVLKLKEEDLRTLAKDLRKVLLPLRQDNHSLLFGLIGPLGSGKTTFLKYLLSEKLVTSPTFNLLKVYSFQDLTAYHWDLYRLDGSPSEIISQLEEIGFREYLDDPAGITFIEWYDKVMGDESLEEIPQVIIEFKLGEDPEMREVAFTFRNLNSSKYIEEIIDKRKV